MTEATATALIMLAERATALEGPPVAAVSSSLAPRRASVSWQRYHCLHRRPLARSSPVRWDDYDGERGTRLKGKIRRDRSGWSLHRRYRNRPRRLFERLRLSRLRSYGGFPGGFGFPGCPIANMGGAVTSSHPWGFPYPGAPATRDSQGWSRFG